MIYGVPQKNSLNSINISKTHKSNRRSMNDPRSEARWNMRFFMPQFLMEGQCSTVYFWNFWHFDYAGLKDGSNLINARLIFLKLGGADH
jgi:hypothetical protein